MCTEQTEFFSFLFFSFVCLFVFFLFVSFLFIYPIKGAPNIASLPDEVKVLKGEEQLITCHADGWPRPNMAWKHKDSYLGNDTRYEIRRNLTLNQVTLVIKFDDDLDEAYYTCEASNAFGTSSSTVMVTFEENDDFGKWHGKKSEPICVCFWQFYLPWLFLTREREHDSTCLEILLKESQNIPLFLIIITITIINI